MRYKPGHKQEKRKELLKASGSLAKKQGFAATGVDALMLAAGVTSGAFYSHFSSKSDLFKALIESEVAASYEFWGNNPHEDFDAWVDAILDQYLSIGHVRHPEAGCVLPSLLAEIGRADVPTREVFESELMKGRDILIRRLGSEDLAWAFISQLVGTILIARAMPTDAAQRAVIEASKRVLKQTVTDRQASVSR